MKQAVGWHELIPGPITRPEEALAFITVCGFCTWGPVPRLTFPNLAEAMGETATSVLDRTWSWKDDLHFENSCTTARSSLASPVSWHQTTCPISSQLWPGAAWSTSGT